MVEQTSWAAVAERLAPSRNYWLCTTRPDGAPHTAPVWGAVVDGVLCFYSERSTVKARNLALDPRVVVHLESGDQVVIVRGRLDDRGCASDIPGFVAALGAKYTRGDDAEYLPSATEAFDAAYSLVPESALVWDLDDWDASQRRWSA